MKSVFAHFKKQQKPKNEAPIDVPTSNDSAQIHHSLGASAPQVFGNSRSFIIVAGVTLFIALGFFGYRFMSGEPQAPIQQNVQLNPLRVPTTGAARDPSLLARELFEEKHIHESLEVYIRALKEKPNDAQVWNDIGVLYLKNQRYTESEMHLRKSIELAPKCFECLNNLGYLKTLTGDSESAVRLFKKAITLNGDYLDPYFNLGVLYEKNGDLAHSANAYREFINRSKDQNSPFNLKLKQHIDSLEK